MILYFSSTGNCKYVSEKLAEALGDRCVSILDADCVHLSHGERLGFVFPTYFWRLPSNVTAYMKALAVTSEDELPYIYFVATYGTTCGQTGAFMKRHLRKKGYALSAAYSVKTVDDWTVWFDLSDPGKVEAILEREAPQIEELITRIRAGAVGDHMKDKLPMLAVMGSGMVYDQMRKTKHLHVRDSCIGCGLCARECPVSAIELRDGRPLWKKDRCAMCLHCLHSCPRFAIQYDKATEDHGQYRHP